MFKKIILLLSKHDKKFLLLLALFSIAISFVEALSVSVIMPFINLAGDFTLVHHNAYYYYIYTLFDFNSESTFIICFGILLIFFYFFRSAINLLYQYVLSKFSKGRYYKISYRIFKKFLEMPYRRYTGKRSSTLTKTILNDTHNVTNLISSLLIILSESFIILFIYTILIYINWKITIVLTGILLLVAFFMIKVISKHIRKIGEKRIYLENIFFHTISSTFGNFKIIKLLNEEKQILKKFSDTSKDFTNIYIRNDTFLNIPKLFVEGLGFSLITAVVIFLVYENQTDISQSLGMLSAFVLALYRLLPSFHRIIGNYNNIQFNLKSLDIVYNEITETAEDLGDEKIYFKESIQLKNLSFSYNEGHTILKDLNLIIKKGSKIAITGKSGGGKSTLIDIIAGLYEIKDSEIYIDHQRLTKSNLRSWRSKIGYIPQTIYLFDGTIAENIAMGNHIEEEKMIHILAQVKIWDFIKNNQGLNTPVGEGGVKLSGGQKQRIAIARALYSNPEVLILDEATSSLDNETEAKIMDEIYNMSQGRTLIIVAHRLSTLDRCDKIYQIENGVIVSERCTP